MANSHQKGSWKEANGQYVIRWRIRDARSKSGWACRMRTLPAGTPKKKMLAELAVQVARANENNNREPIKSDPTETGLTFRQFTDGLWTRYLDSENRKPATRATYDSLLDNWLLPRFGNVPLRDITVAMCTELFIDLNKRSPATRVLVYSLLLNMLNLAEDHQLIASIPLKRKRHRPKLPKSPKPAYPLDVIRQIVLAADPEYRAILWTFAMTGLRAGEVSALRWSDVDFDAGLIHVRTNLWRGRLQTPKTEGSQAPIGLPPMLADVLAGHKAVSRWTEPDDFVFVMLDGRPYTQDRLTRKVLRPARERAGIKYERSKTGFHLFRRSLATYIGEHTGIMQAQVQLRHESATTTEEYLHPDQSVIHSNAAVIESAFTLKPESNRVQ